MQEFQSQDDTDQHVRSWSASDQSTLCKIEKQKKTDFPGQFRIIFHPYISSFEFSPFQSSKWTPHPIPKKNFKTSHFFPRMFTSENYKTAPIQCKNTQINPPFRIPGFFFPPFFPRSFLPVPAFFWITWTESFNWFHCTSHNFIRVEIDGCPRQASKHRPREEVGTWTPKNIPKKS